MVTDTEEKPNQADADQATSEEVVLTEEQKRDAAILAEAEKKLAAEQAGVDTSEAEETAKETAEENTAPTFTDEQLAEIAANPTIRQRVLEDDATADALQQTLDELDQTRQEKARAEEETRKRQSTFQDAVKAYNDGDKDALADFSFDYFRTQLQNQRLQAIAEESTSSAVGERMEQLAQQRYPEEYKRLQSDPALASEREMLGKIEDDNTFYGEVFATLDKIRSSATDATTDDRVDAAEKAAASAVTAAKARGDVSRSASLPAAVHESSEEAEVRAAGTNIGSLMRLALKDDIAEINKD